MQEERGIHIGAEEEHGHHVGVVTHHELKQSLTTLQLWAIAVGLVISGEYFGWSYGWAQRGHARLHRDGAVHRRDVYDLHLQFHRTDHLHPPRRRPVRLRPPRLGPIGGYFAGAATLIEFVFAPPAIALAIGAYLNVQFPALDPKPRGIRRLHHLHGAEHHRRRDRSDLRTRRHDAGDLRTARLHGRRVPDSRWANFSQGRLGGRRTASASAAFSACSPRSPSPSGSSSPLKAPPWRPRKPRIRDALDSASPTSPAF